jgi:cytochrome c oxidase subunit 2
MKTAHAIIMTAVPALIFFILAGCTGAPDYPYSRGGAAPVDGSFSSNGQRIYFTATSSSGQPIIPEGFNMMMHRITCADCHGPDGKGGQVTMMMQSFNVPDITWPHLTEEEHEAGGEHEEHPPYTEETVKIAITQGLEPSGEQLDNTMPRWRISDQDLNDLVGYLKTLK